MIGFISRIGKPFYKVVKKITGFVFTSDGDYVKTADGKFFKVQP